MSTRLCQALVPSRSEYDFEKNWTHSLRGCSDTAAEVEMHPYTRS